MRYFPIPAKLAQGQLTGSDVALYTADAAPTSGPPPIVIVKEIVLTNTDTVTRTVTINVRTGAVNANNRIASAYSIDPGPPVAFNLSMVLAAGEIISGLASTTAVVNYRISGVRLLTVQTST